VGTKLKQTMNSNTIRQTILLQFFCTIGVAGYWRGHTSQEFTFPTVNNIPDWEH